MRIFTPMHMTVPKNTETFSREIRMVQKGTCACAKAAERQSLNRENIFPENKKPRFGDIRQNDPRQMAPFCNHGLVFANLCFTNFTPCMLSQITA
jgi:hypothetical protein